MESLLVAVKRLRTVKRSARPWASAQVGATFARWRTMSFRLGRDKHWSLPLLGSRPPAMLIAAVLAIGGTVASVGGPLVGSSEPVEYGIWGDDVTPGLVADRETKAVTLGVKFKSADHGWINGIQFYRSAENVGPHRGQLWTSRGKLLATVEFPETDEVGWLTARFDVPVEIVAGRTYVASYRAPEGRYAGDVNTLSRRKKATTGSLTAWQGVYTYGLGRPDKVWWNSNYYVDVLFSRVNMSAPIAPETKTVIAPATPVPATTVATTVPATTVATTVPATTVATTVPATTVATTVPATTVATTVPATTVATTVPATTVATTVPATTVATDGARDDGGDDGARDDGGDHGARDDGGDHGARIWGYWCAWVPGARQYRGGSECGVDGGQTGLRGDDAGGCCRESACVRHAVHQCAECDGS